MHKKAFPILLLLFVTHLSSKGMAQSPPWTGTWSASPQDGNTKFEQQTLRQMVYVSIGGTHVRIHLDNLFTDSPATLTDVHIAPALSGSSIDPNRDAVLTFSGSGSVTIAPGTSVVSDPIAFTVEPLSTLAISFYLPDSVPRHLRSHCWPANPLRRRGRRKRQSEFARCTDRYVVLFSQQCRRAKQRSVWCRGYLGGIHHRRRGWHDKHQSPLAQ